MPLCFTTAIFLGSLSSFSFASCPNGNTGYIDHATLSGKTVCVGGAGNWENQEYHAPGGNLIDWKKGASDPKDPTKSIGSWAVSGSGSNQVINYTYNTGESYSYRVHNNGSGNYSFCNGATEIVSASIKTGQSACP
jgi:hypothetical protein